MSVWQTLLVFVGIPAGIISFVALAVYGKSIVRLEYEAYRPMAERTLAEIGVQLAAEHPGARLAIVHRVGKLAVGDAAVVIAASAPHRGVAFEVCRAAIDRLKKSVPIWKKEHFEGGEIWIGCQASHPPELEPRH